MEQLNIFDETIYQPLKTENHLTTRQWKLHNLLLASGKSRLERKDMLEKLDSYYGYSQELALNPKRTFINLSCLRELTDDLDAIQRDETIQHVFVGGGYAVSKKEAELYLLKEKISALKRLKKMYVQKAKLILDGQQRLVFNKEKDQWDSILKVAEEELKTIEATA